MRITRLNPIGALAACALLAACQSQTAPSASTSAGAQIVAAPAGATAAAPASGGAPSVAGTPAAASARSAGRAAAQGTPAARQAQSAATAQATATPAAGATVAVDGALGLTSPPVNAAFEASGKVTAVRVTPGQSVKQGDMLAELDRSALDTALQQAKAQLAQKRAEIEKNLAPATQAEIDTAKLALTSASAAYGDLKKGPSAGDVESALRSWNQAKNSLYSAQLARDEECGWVGISNESEKIVDAGNIDCKQADRNVQTSVLRERSAYQQYQDARKPATDAELTKAWSSVVQAQAALASVEKGASEEQKHVYDLQLQQAQLSVDRATRDLADAVLLAPCDCVVQDVSLAAGTSGGSVTLLDLASVAFFTSNLSERDVVKLSVGQTASVRLKAVTGALTGKVAAILPQTSGTASSAALYTAVIRLDSTQARLLPGMTGQADISLK